MGLPASRDSLRRRRVDHSADLRNSVNGKPAQVKSAPGTFATWTTPALQQPVTVVGTPTLRVRISAPAAAQAQAAGPAGQLVLFAKILDVDKQGTASTIRGLVAPIRIQDATKPVRISLPGIVHRFAAGHSIRIVIAGASNNYRGGLVANPVSIAGGVQQVLRLPVT